MASLIPQSIGSSKGECDSPLPCALIGCADLSSCEMRRVTPSRSKNHVIPFRALHLYNTRESHCPLFSGEVEGMRDALSRWRGELKRKGTPMRSKKGEGGSGDFEVVIKSSLSIAIGTGRVVMKRLIIGNGGWARKMGKIGRFKKMNHRITRFRINIKEEILDSSERFGDRPYYKRIEDTGIRYATIQAQIAHTSFATTDQDTRWIQAGVLRIHLDASHLRCTARPYDTHGGDYVTRIPCKDIIWSYQIQPEE